MLRPEFGRISDVCEDLYQLGQRGIPVEATIAAVEYPNGEPAWALLLEGEVKGVCPLTETGVEAKAMPRMVGQTVHVVVKGIDRDLRLAACSRREAVAKAWERLKGTLKVGQVVDAGVRCILPPAEKGQSSSLLVDIGGGVLAEVPKKEAAIYHSKSLLEQFRPGQIVKAKIMSVEPLEVSIRQARPDSFACTVFHRGQSIACTVAHIWTTPKGERIVLVEPDAAPGMLGIAPYPYLGEVSRGDRLVCVVASYRPEKRQLRCRIRGWA